MELKAGRRLRRIYSSLTCETAAGNVLSSLTRATPVYEHGAHHIEAIRVPECSAVHNPNDPAELAGETQCVFSTVNPIF